MGDPHSDGGGSEAGRRVPVQGHAPVPRRDPLARAGPAVGRGRKGPAVGRDQHGVHVQIGVDRLGHVEQQRVVGGAGTADRVRHGAEAEAPDRPVPRAQLGGDPLFRIAHLDSGGADCAVRAQAGRDVAGPADRRHVPPSARGDRLRRCAAERVLEFSDALLDDADPPIAVVPAAIDHRRRFAAVVPDQPIAALQERREAGGQRRTPRRHPLDGGLHGGAGVGEVGVGASGPEHAEHFAAGVEHRPAAVAAGGGGGGEYLVLPDAADQAAVGDGERPALRVAHQLDGGADVGRHRVPHRDGGDVGRGIRPYRLE